MYSETAHMILKRNIWGKTKQNNTTQHNNNNEALA